MPGKSDSPKKIFISYRHDDGVAMADSICRRLEEEFGKGTVFRDLDIAPGANYLTSIDEAIAGCAFVLVVIGQNWLRPPVETVEGQRVQEGDVVMFEIESALEHGVQVIPVFVDGGKMPPQSKLPGNISTFHYRQGVAVGYEPHFDFDIGLLIRRIGPSLRSQRSVTSALWSKWLPQFIIYSLVLLGILFLYSWVTPRLVSWVKSVIG